MKNMYGGIALFLLAYIALVVIFEFSLLPYITVAVLSLSNLFGCFLRRFLCFPVVPYFL
jgi:hypothetical protein